jgi:signal transduction histidine kinase
VLQFHGAGIGQDERELRSVLAAVGALIGQYLARMRVARETDRLKDEFVALVSHELRTPLTSIIGYLEVVLDEDELDPAARRWLQVVERNAHRLLRLVGDLLFIARLEAGQLALDAARPIDLVALAEQSVQAAQPYAEGAGVTIALSGRRPDGPCWGDADRIAQVLDNLVSNALKFTPTGGRVDVRLRGEGGCAVIEVADTGVGIPAGELESLFQRFFRASTATRDKIAGVGLGLSIAKAIVEAHGGAIEVESEEGSGATFRVRLPLGDPPGRPAPGPLAAAAAAAAR